MPYAIGVYPRTPQSGLFWNGPSGFVSLGLTWPTLETARQVRGRARTAAVWAGSDSGVPPKHDQGDVVVRDGRADELVHQIGGHRVVEDRA